MLRSAALIVVALCLVQLAAAQQFQLCTYTDPSSGKSYDLTALAQQFTTKASGSPPDPSGYTYYNSPCQSVQGVPSCTLNPSVCQVSSTGSYLLGSLGKASAGPLTSGGEGFAVTFQPQDNRGSTVNYVCDASAGVGQFKWTYVPPNGQQPYLWIFEWRTQYACPTGGGGGSGGSGASSSGGGISGGWIFVICLVSVTLVYFAGGVVVQKFVFKKEGVEMIPNSAFWLVLPGLIKDGHVFVYKSVRRLFGGGYQQI